MRLPAFILLLIFTNTLAIHAQQVTFSPTKIIAGNFSDVEIDNLGNVYTISADNQLKKWSSNGDSIAVFNDVRRYGKLFSADVTNPLKILLFYKEFATILVVDRFLNVRTTIDLRKLNIFQVKVIGLSYDNNIWVYDELEAKLKRVGDDGSLIDESTDLRQVVDSLPDPVVLADQGGYVYLYDTAHGVYSFDHYGAFQKRVALHNWKDFHVIDKLLLGHDTKQFLKFQQGLPDIEAQPMPPFAINAMKVTITPTSLVVLKPEAVELFTRTP